ncbi:complement C3-like [Nematolebias whitei]|uniref:complement C3-like n=1 Tax=Nematolebias whitei TaxID=451745 RepID=UPI00189B93C6|nr:complement C3-like [Nematolebias whitei]
MGKTLLWLLASLAFASLTSFCNGESINVLSAPNLLRVGTEESILVECHGCSGAPFNVEIRVFNHPTKTRELARTSVTLNSGNKFQQLGKITIPAEDFSKDPAMKQNVYLRATFPDNELEKVVLVSLQSGYIFIQTDKTLYTPNSKVNYRIFALTPQMKAMEKKEQIQNADTIVIEIETSKGIIVPITEIAADGGVFSGVYPLGEIVSPGMWKVVTKFQSNPQQRFSAEFEVKEYVLPSFEVKLSSEKPFFYVDSEDLTINIKAMYLFGEEVDGTAYVVFGIMENGVKKSLPHSLSRVPVQNGEGRATLRREQITQTFTDINSLVGTSIYVAVSVLTESRSEMVEAEIRGIQIVTSPYRISFKKTPKYFKSGLYFDVTVEVVNPDDSPAVGIPVVLSPGGATTNTAASGIARFVVNTKTTQSNLTIIAKTNEPLITNERQASASMTASSFTTGSNNYIHISIRIAEVKVGDDLNIDIRINNPQSQSKYITFLITSRGQLVKSERYQTSKETQIGLTLPVTKEMLPSFRIIAYYHPTDNEVVSDSVWVDVKDSCMGSLTLKSSRAVPSYEPRRMFGLGVTGDPGATVGLVAVDKGVYVLNNKHRLSQKKVWDLVEKYDTGCTPGRGSNHMNVFFDAGLMFMSSSNFETPYRKELNCKTSPRHKRATTIMEVRNTLVSQYENEQQRKCCLDGMKEIPLSYTCERRAEYILDGQACVDAFLNCCKEMKHQIFDKKEENLILARSEDDDTYIDSHNIVSRTNFPESWLWLNFTFPHCPNCVSTSFTHNVPLPDSITTWQLTGISLSRTSGICVSEPLEVIVRKEFFIDLRLPYSAVRGEQLEIKAILHNYSPDPISARVELIEEKNVCSAAYKRGKYRQVVRIGPHTTRSVPFVIIPMKEGEHSIEVKAAVHHSSVYDGVKKMLRVVPEGVLVQSAQTVTLFSTRKGVNGKQEVTISSNISMTDLVPNSPTNTQVFVTGREQVSGLVENAISGNSMGTLIQAPGGCGEQNMIGMTLPLIATIYLDKTNQWETVGFRRRTEALEHIKTGYGHQLQYRKGDGSFAVWSHLPSSSWLTAYVAKVFAIANSLVAVQNDHICGAVTFLILNAQQPDGMFREVRNVDHGEMIGDVRGKDSDASMTAFCLIAMQESRTICAESVSSLPACIDKSVRYLEKRLPSLINPYAVAITSYALANQNKLNKEMLLRFASPDLSHWPIPEKPMFTLEATAYALLALVKAKAFEDAKPVVRWFNQQQFVGGGYGSTQATIMVYQALTEYWTYAKEPDYDLNVDILLPGRSNPDKYNFKMENHYVTRTSKVNGINQAVKVITNGTGEATVKMVSLYYAIPGVKKSDCQKFNMSVTLIPENMAEDERTYKLKIEVLYLDKERDSTMSILDISLLTGFTVNTGDLDLLSTGPARTIDRYEMNRVLSERGSLIIYLNRVSHIRPEEVAFRIHQTFKVGVLQPAAVSVYEYYEKQPCVKFYHPERADGQMLQLCKDYECRCAEENCSMQKSSNINNDERTAKICESTEISKIEYAYKVMVEGIEFGLSTDSYIMRIVEVIKHGNIDVGSTGKLRTFLSYQHCRKALNLRKGKTYLIMGSSKDTHIDDKHNTFQYVLGERTWVEYWPTSGECQDAQYRPTCLGMEDMVDNFLNFACLG